MKLTILLLFYKKNSFIFKLLLKNSFTTTLYPGVYVPKRDYRMPWKRVNFIGGATVAFPRCKLLLLFVTFFVIKIKANPGR